MGTAPMIKAGMAEYESPTPAPMNIPATATCQTLDTVKYAKA